MAQSEPPQVGLLACFRCFGIVCSKRLLTNCQRTGIQGHGLLIVALRFPKLREFLHGPGRFEMLRSKRLFADVQRALVERLRLGIPALLTIEVRQVGERIGHIGMLRSQELFSDPYRTLVEGLRLGIPALIPEIERRFVEQASCFFANNLISLDDLYCCQCLRQQTLTLRPDLMLCMWKYRIDQ